MVNQIDFSTRTKSILTAILTVLLLSYGAFEINNSWKSGIKMTEHRSLKIANSIEIMLNNEGLKNFNDSIVDDKSPIYINLKKSLIDIVNLHNDFSYVFLFKKKDNKLYALIDSEPVGSNMMVAPGTIYSDTATAILKPFETGEPFISDKITNKRGTNVTVFVPVKNKDTGELYAVLGLEYPADRWTDEATQNVTNTVYIELGFLLLCILIFFIYLNNKRLKLSNIKRNKTIEQMTAYAAVFEQSDDHMTVKDLDLRIVAINNIQVKELGKSNQAELLGKTDAEIFGIPETMEPVKTYMADERDAQKLKVGEYIFREENYITPTGITKTVQTKKYPIFNKDNKLILTANISRDVTAQKLIEAELIKAKEMAEAASVAKSDFLSNMSHEIRTPLNGVIGFTDLLLNTKLSKIQKEYLDNAIISANSLLGVISDILDFSKIESGKLELEIVKTDIVQLIESASDIIKVHAAGKGVELLLDIQPDIPRFALIDPIRLKQILVNLMSNAVKFTHKGEVELKISFEKKDDKVGFFTLGIRDTGIGVKDEDKNKLFKAFSQADTSTTRRYGGTGLGLIISNSLAHKMNSRIEFESEYGKGSRFFFTLETEYEESRINYVANIDHVKRVLVVDDNTNNRLILQHTFAHWGIDYYGCPGGADAVELLKVDTDFDLIIMDYHMPDLNGLDTVKIIRTELNLSLEELPIILLHSSSDDSTIHEAAKELGIRFSLTKPIKSNELFYFLQNIKDYSIVDEYDDKPNAVKGSQKQKPLQDEYNVLIAEDIKMNMLVIENMLKNIIPNARLFEAANGTEVLKLLESFIPELILMDVQMPVMDGVETTKQIRMSDRPELKTVPIVALTAGVSKEERESCYNAGMNDFLSKPIDKNALYEKIVKYLKGTVLESIKPRILDERVEMHFNKVKLMDKIGNSCDLYQNLIDLSLIEYPKFIETLSEALENNNITAIKTTAHTLKGSSYNMEYVQLGNLAQELENNIDKPDELQRVFKEINSEWSIIMELLK